MASSISGAEKALRILRELPRVSLNNLRDNPGSRMTRKKNRGKSAIKYYGFGFSRQGHGHKKMRQHGCLPPLGFEGGKVPFYLSIPQEFYYKGFHLRRQYPPLSLIHLQRLIDVGRIDAKQPIDLTQIVKAGFSFSPTFNHYGINLTEDGADVFKAQVNIEVQWTNEVAIAAVERNGGVITTAYYDRTSVWCASAPQHWFKQGNPIPKRMLPPQDAIAYYTDAKNRGYLADPQEVEAARQETGQKFGYDPPEPRDSPISDVLRMRKHRRQVFYGLEPGWLVNLSDETILKPKDKRLTDYYTEP